MYRAVDQFGQVIDVYVSKRRNIAAARTFFKTMLAGRGRPRLEWDHGRLKARLRPMRGLRTDQTASTVIRNQANRLTSEVPIYLGLLVSHRIV